MRIRPSMALFRLALLPVVPAATDGDRDVIYEGRPVSAWAAALADPDPAVRLAAVKEMETPGPGAFAIAPLLAAATGDAVAEVRHEAVKALSHLAMKLEDALDALAGVLGSSDPEVRARAVETIGILGQGTMISDGPEMIDIRKSDYLAVVERLADEDRDVRVAALRALGSMARRPGAVPEAHVRLAEEGMIRTLQDPETSVRRAASEALDRYRPASALAGLTRALENESEDVHVRHRAALALSGMNPRPGVTFRQLAEVLNNGDPNVRERALDAMGSLMGFIRDEARYPETAGIDLAVATAAFTRSLSDSPWIVRMKACRLMEALGAMALPAAPALVGVLEDREQAVSISALVALEAIVGRELLRDRRAVESLGRHEWFEWPLGLWLEKLGSDATDDFLNAMTAPLEESRTVQLRRIGLAGKLGPDAPGRAIAALSPSLDSPSPSVRLSVVTALGKLAPSAPQALPLLAKAVEDQDESVRIESLKVLGRMGPEAAQARAILEKAAKDEDKLVRWEAAKALEAVFGPEPVPLSVLEERLRTGDGESRWRALVEARRAGVLRAEALPILIELLREDDLRLRSTAAAAIRGLGAAGLPAVPALIEAARGSEGTTHDVLVSAVVSMARLSGEPIPEVARALGSDDAAIRHLAVSTLRSLGKDAARAVPALEETLQDPEPLIRIEAAITIVKTGRGTEAAARAIVEGCRDPRSWNEPGSRALRPAGDLRADLMKSLRTIYQVQSPRDLTALGEVMRSQDHVVRQWAIGWIGEEGHRAASLVPMLLEAMGDSAPETRAAAASALRNVATDGGEVVPAFRKALLDGSPRVRSAAAGSLGGFPREAATCLPDLMDALRDPDSGVRSAAAGALGAVGPQARPALELLLREALGGGYITSAAAKAIWDIDPEGGTIMPRILEALRAPETLAAGKAALQPIGLRAAPAVPLLAEGLDIPVQEVRMGVLQALGRVGPGAGPAVARIIRNLEDPDGGIRWASAEALGMMGPAARPTVPGLAAMIVREKDGGLRRSHVLSLWRLGPDAEEAIPILVDAMAEDATAMRAASALSLLPPHSRWAESRLVQALAHPHPVARHNAAFNLDMVGVSDPDSVPALVRGLGDADFDVRRWCARLLGRLGPAGRAAVPELRRLREEDPFPFVREAAADALEKIGESWSTRLGAAARYSSRPSRPRSRPPNRSCARRRSRGCGQGGSQDVPRRISLSWDGPWARSNTSGSARGCGAERAGHLEEEVGDSTYILAGTLSRLEQPKVPDTVASWQLSVAWGDLLPVGGLRSDLSTRRSPWFTGRRESERVYIEVPQLRERSEDSPVNRLRMSPGAIALLSSLPQQHTPAAPPEPTGPSSCKVLGNVSISPYSCSAPPSLYGE